MLGLDPDPVCAASAAVLAGGVPTIAPHNTSETDQTARRQKRETVSMMSSSASTTDGLVSVSYTHLTLPTNREV